jgi:hypothetical protein
MMFIVNANASILYDNGVTIANWDNSYLSSELQDGTFTQYSADDFTLSSTSIIQDVHWLGNYFPTDSPPTSDDFVVRIYNDNGGVPFDFGSEIYSYVLPSVTRTDTGFDFDNTNVYEYSAIIDPFLAQAGDTYWLEIFNQIENVGWFWGFSFEDAGNTAYRYIPGFPDWENVPLESAFQLTGTVVPEPSTFLLLGGGLAGLAFVVRCRRKE